MKKSYFMRTLHIDGCLLLTSFFLFVSDYGFKVIGVFLQNQTDKNLIEYTQFLYKYVMIVYHGLHQALAVSVLITIAFIIPEIIARIWKDSIKNVVRSIWLSFRIRNFLKIQATYEDKEGKIFKYNRAIKKAIIDIQNTSVVFVVKLPNELGVHTMIFDNRVAMREEIANRLPEYSFSDIQRVKGYLRLEGTKIR
ncbi:hypothetical protein D5K58_04425 [Listeria monocytogenes]|uniref:hypothetical protein n=1 Tax=Listeria monocytogenes TaxID=1639 RepID=UPI00074D5930|nr:hypothetical protein [Listeria monocytogenes]EAG9790471.1 hypothetical protein [Listeria monocytogenes]EAH0902350.1 hypothetical protein [Listeria monocytogenes]EAH2660124.1 hypothetical protein [Listeria monocytogenes]EIT8055248.1 hypothetical protein [Listeria monocytogenes]CUL64916.1 Predicted protein [Listeria monocytogenes]